MGEAFQFEKRDVLLSRQSCGIEALHIHDMESASVLAYEVEFHPL